MSQLHAAMAIARTAPAHPFTITDLGDGNRDYGWACPAECSHAQDQCPMLHRLRQADIIDLADNLPAGNYLAVPTLWGVDLTGLDGAAL
jgi:hypothetical protein